jgi:flagellar biosynthesis component FlhA
MPPQLLASLFAAYQVAQNKWELEQMRKEESKEKKKRKKRREKRKEERQKAVMKVKTPQSLNNG